MIKKAMIIGVGVGKYVESAIYASMKMNNPNFVVFIVSPDSKGTLDRLVQQHDVCLRDIYECEKFTINDPEDIDDVFRSCEKALFFLFKKGFSASEIVVDITSGTKVMSAALAALAILYELYSITYVGGGRRNEGGIVMQGTEKPKELKPLHTLYKHELDAIKKFFSKYQFYTCKLMIQDLVGKFKNLEEESEPIHDDIKKIIDGFISWERFDHEKALTCFTDVKYHDVKIQQGYLGKVKDDRKTEAAKHPSLKGKVPTKHLIVDIFQNAKRRADEGNFDDAVARLYRCMEMVGQYALLQYDIVSSDVDLEKLQGKITDALFQKLEKHKDCGKIKIGLVEDFEILSELNENDDTAIAYSKYREDLKRYLNSRNESILAHGMKPICEDQYTEMCEIVYEIVKSVVSDVDEKLSEIERCFDSNVLSRNYAGS